MKRILILVISLMVTPLLAQNAMPKNITKAYEECLVLKATNGQYSSFDGGKSAIRLMGECSVQWKAWTDACRQTGNPDCDLKSGLLAQVALKLINK